MDILAKIKGIKYNPFLCRNLKIFDFENLRMALDSCASFILNINKENKIAISWWVSSKRTRSYPYARVYDTLNFSGKKITIIPVIKDEGKEGDRDFLQWDTVSLMSLLGIYVIIAYYTEAEKSKRYRHKITNQRFDTDYIKEQINKILSYQSDALHWNLFHVDKVGYISQKAIESYLKISKKLKIEMHSWTSVEKRINKLLKGRNDFMKLSRILAKKAQKRESLTIQPKENLSGIKAKITIRNYLGGYYYFTSDEIELKNDTVFLIEGKHSKTNFLPSLEDIKDGLLKMILFTNLEDIKINGKKYHPKSVLKLTTKANFDLQKLNNTQKHILKFLDKEAKTNGFLVKIN
ncbi:hypothetical protein COS50_00895 [Candidatus Roizmanbacteria bacterium CG03_land_8_20_14_0_80_35_26]|uniref:Uncharacterized protein n=5 Tax=Candidatus Roizmaniibacteriota TaxID=1752723 RepID=A0A2M7BXN0_9BACT|nr:MAG: hypothetical protein COX47_04120 [Candidatus Roizmanbacteria bacterium CG23_combo_of_CG06-09_8_20_14_all_35_49]PIP62886.1 MAG: hypothetical protein COW98_01570 [Candidatus Roizmanbacteria bacterium CG22_combo_CG10-13_8_21_14_all_35_9]PIV11321.1 MAG: hypothetical protein COS50_00895 [Candidatus Roizmanbacteria bacterium CG03_land_8_20_14_0_80_35_26]PIY70661.1 MAG: hypothetical protein COY88_04410 [Candidatus Roizmanbacteria bacterium CG_4_10_14_0_8_um_filter_35_28]PJC33938.1 MAG: hypothe